MDKMYLTSLKFLQGSGTIDVRNREPTDTDNGGGGGDGDGGSGGVERRNDWSNDVQAKAELNSNFKVNCTGWKPQSSIALLKSAPNFRVLFPGFNKTKPENDNKEEIPAAQKHQLHKSPEYVQSKWFAVECDVEEVQIASSFFSRNKILRSELQSEYVSDFPDRLRKSPKDFLKYLKLIKPLYVRASKRYSPRKIPAAEKHGVKGAGLRALSKHLGKRQSSSSSSNVQTTPSPARRRDDSLLLQADGIQNAILHCKRSLSLYNTSSQGIGDRITNYESNFII